MQGTKRATLIKSELPGMTGDARLYRLDPPASVASWHDDEKRSVEYVVVSAVNAMFSGPETYIFEGNAKGEVVDWGELEGSFKGDYDHGRALRGLGYEVAQ